eukprot:scaffold2150_cov102-Skeletonema_marinoi.AAC.2
MKLNANNGHIGKAVAECLTSKHALNKFYRGDCLAEILNQIAGLQGDDSLSAKNIAKADNACQFPLSDGAKTTLKGKVSKKRVYSNGEQPQKPTCRKRSNKKQAGDGEAAKEDAPQHEVNIRRLEEKYRRAKKTHDAAIAVERKAGDELRGVHAELNTARSQLESSSKGDRSVPQETAARTTVKRITMRTSLMLMTMFSTIRMVNAEGKSDLTKMMRLNLMTCNRTHSSLSRADWKGPSHTAGKESRSD